MSKKRKQGLLGPLLLTALVTVLAGLVCGFAVLLLTPERVSDDTALLVVTPAPDLATVPPEPTAAPTPEMTPEPTPEPTPTPVPDSDAVLRVVGDLMCHDRQLASALNDDGSYSMESWFDDIRGSLQAADLTIGNLETSFAGPEEDYSGFPHFNTPDAFADALKNAGFDVLTLANNHIYDFRADGIARTIGVLEDRGFAHTGAYAAQEDFDRLLILDVNGIRVGILSYTDTFNSTPKHSWQVRALSGEQAERDIAAMRDAGAEFILCMVHWGDEYEENHDHSQERQAQMLADAGADAIFGSHPHVVQDAQMLTAALPDGTFKTVPVAYSMGNFISNQQNRPCDIGVIFELRLHKSGADGAVTIEQSGYVPTVVYRWHEHHKDRYSVLPCGVFKEIDGHDKQRRCRKVWEWMIGEMGEGFEVIKE